MDNLYYALSEQMVEKRLRIGPVNEDKFYNDYISIGSNYRLYLSSHFPIIKANLLSPGGIFNLQFIVSGFHNKVTLAAGESLERVLTKEEFLDLVREEHPELFEWMIWNLVGRNEE
jgi:hypothetical protein